MLNLKPRADLRHCEFDHDLKWTGKTHRRGGRTVVWVVQYHYRQGKRANYGTRYVIQNKNGQQLGGWHWLAYNTSKDRAFDALKLRFPPKAKKGSFVVQTGPDVD